MVQEINKSLTETAQVEQEALALVQSDMNSAESDPMPSPAQKVATKVTRREIQPRRNARDQRRASREMFADKSVPRIRAERRYGGSSHSRAYLKQALCLYSDRAQIFFENNYERVNMNLIVSTLVIEAMGGTDLAEEVSLRLEKEFRDLETQMINSIKELQRIATAKGIPEDKQVPAYDHKRFYEPPLHTPHSAQFMTVVQLFDRLISRAEGCWINHVMSPQTRKNVVQSWEKKLVKFVRDLNDIRTQAVAQARKKGYGQRAATIEENVRRQQANEHLEKKDVATTTADAKPATDTQNPTPKQDVQAQVEIPPGTLQVVEKPAQTE